MRSDRFRAAAERADFAAIGDLFDPAVVFRSPVVFKPYEGTEALAVLLGAVAEVFEDFRYVDQLESEERAVLIFKARIRERELDGVDILRFGADGRITELTVMVRPMSAMHALAEAMAEKLAARAPAG